MSGYYINQYGEPVGQLCPTCKKPIFYKLDEIEMKDNKMIHKECKK